MRARSRPVSCAVAAFLTAVALAACGEADPGARITPGPATTTSPSPASSPPAAGDAAAATSGDAAVDGGYRDPAHGDGACASPNAVCGAACVAVNQDADNCGRCGNACMGLGAVCLGGQCGCAAVGRDYCAGAGCMDITSDVNNCGTCGNVCDPNQFTACESGSCVP